MLLMIGFDIFVFQLASFGSARNAVHQNLRKKAEPADSAI